VPLQARTAFLKLMQLNYSIFSNSSATPIGLPIAT
jgi:hypothetical protein